MVPTAETSFSCNKIAIEYTLADGSTETIETRVMGKERAVATYEDRVAAG